VGFAAAREVPIALGREVGVVVSKSTELAMSKRSKQYEDRDHTPRERILRAAAECFAKTGYERTRMVAVAREANVSRAALYKHFPGKAELLLAFNDLVSSEWRIWTQESVAVSESASQAVERWLREGLADEWRVTLVRAVTTEDAQGELLADRGVTQAALRETRRVLALVLQRGVDSGELRADLDVEATAHALQAILMGLLRNHTSDRPIISLERRREIDALVELVLQGLKGSSKRTRPRAS
jgi:AcrR family transcriptional regulator